MFVVSKKVRLFFLAAIFWITINQPQLHNRAVVDLTNRFHVAVRLLINRLLMKSKCGRNRNVARDAIAEYVTDVVTTF